MRITGVRVVAVLVGLVAILALRSGLPLSRTHTQVLDLLWVCWGVAALVCAVGIWRRQRWAVWLFDGLALTNLALFAARQQATEPLPWATLLGILALVAGVYAAFSLYLGSQLKRRPS